MVTSHEVARLAGVSQPTVSRALRDSAKVSAETKQRVREAAAALGYVPSAMGRALSVGRSYRVGLLLTDLQNQFYPHVIASMHDALEDLGYQLALLTESSEAGPIADRIASSGMDGVLLATTTLDSILPVRLRDRRIPFVYFNRTSSSVEADSVTVDPSAGIAAMIKTLVDLGHREVAAIFGPRNTSTGESRESCIRDALDDADIKIPPRWTRHGPFDFETGHVGARELLGTRDRPTVILCGNDVVALGALNAAAEIGVDVPGEVSIVGFDDLPTSSWALIQLTTVAFDLDAMSREAARLLVQRIEVTSDTAYVHAVYPTELRLRRTLGRPSTLPSAPGRPLIAAP
jgi:LacI family transcriptional regulator